MCATGDPTPSSKRSETCRASGQGAGEPDAAQLLSDCDAEFAPKEDLRIPGHLVGIGELPGCDEHDDHVSPLPVILPKAACQRSRLLKLASPPNGAGTQTNTSVLVLQMMCDQSAQEKLHHRVGDASIWFDIGTPGWSVAHVAGCVELLLGRSRGSPCGRSRPDDLELTRWVHRKEREHFIEWVQEAYCQIREGTGPTSQVYQRRLRIRPPALKQKGLAYEVSASLSAPLESSHAMLDVLNFRLVETSAKTTWSS